MKNLYVSKNCYALIADFESVTLERPIEAVAPPAGAFEDYRLLYSRLVPEYLRTLRANGENDAADELVKSLWSDI
jgi:hypothetical protein